VSIDAMFFDGTKKARVAHRCDSCATTIPAGSRYARRTYKFEGDLCDEALHTWCRAELEWFLDAVEPDDFCWDEVGEFVDEQLRDFGVEEAES
jgi:hypothetical protein